MVSRRNVSFFLSLFCIGLLFLSAQSLSAQITSEKGAIRIALTDPQGASIGGAKVFVTSKTGAAQTKESNPDGSVVFPLPTQVPMTLRSRIPILGELSSMTWPSM